jgi:FMN-binding domain
MPKRGAFALALTAFALALLLNFQTPADVATVVRPNSGAPGAGTKGNIPGGTGSSGTGSNGTGSNGTGGASGATPGASVDPAGKRTVQGPTVDTRWGPVQVAVTVQDHQLVDVAALQLPAGGRSGRISSAVEPILRTEALQAQGANIDGVSGATYTSQAYERSLQAALDAAGA